MKMALLQLRRRLTVFLSLIPSIASQGNIACGETVEITLGVNERLVTISYVVLSVPRSQCLMSNVVMAG